MPQGWRGQLAPSGPAGARRAATLPRPAIAPAMAKAAHAACQGRPVMVVASVVAPAAVIPKPVPVLMTARAEGRVSSGRRRATMLLNGDHANPALVIASTMPRVRTGRLDAPATRPVPTVARPRPSNT